MNLYEHQKSGLEATKDLNHVAYYWDMGLGKTFVGSEKMLQLGENANLVVCQKSKINDWYDHFETNYEDWCDHIFDLTNVSQLDVFMWEVSNGTTCVGIINYDLAWRRPELRKLKDFTLLLDESSMIQNEKAKRTKFILKMHPKNVILLSGTPTGGKYERLWSQMRLLGWNISKELYWNTFVITKQLDLISGRSIPIVVGYKNVDRLKRKMAEYGCQFLKTNEVFDLPSQNFQKISVPSSSQYRKFKKTGIVTFDDPYDVENGYTLVGDTTLTKMLYERQLCGIYSQDKLKAFSDLLDSTEDRLIVFYNFTEELYRLIKIAGEHKRKFGVVNGKMKNPEVLDGEGAILFVQYQAGAMGLNLQKANKIIYYSLPLSSELFEQSKKRIHRIGQDRPCFYYLLICKGSIEESILRTLKQRKDYTNRLFEKEQES
ncbi:SNF2-related protein [Anaerotignum sp.]